MRLDVFVDAGDRGAAAAEHDLVDGVVVAGGEEELQEAADLLGHGVLERLQHFGFVVVGQSALALDAAGILVGQAVTAHDLLGQLASTEGLFAGIDKVSVVQHVEAGHGGADVEDGDGLAFAVLDQLIGHGRVDVLDGVGLDIHHHRREAADFRGGAA